MRAGLVMMVLVLVLAGCGPAQAPLPPTAAPAVAAVASPSAAAATPVLPTSVSTPAAQMPVQQAFFVAEDGTVQVATQRDRTIAQVAGLPGDAYALRISPDSRLVAFLTAGRLVVQDLESGQRSDVSPPDLLLEAREEELMPGNTETATALLEGMSWSPDSLRLAYAVDAGPAPYAEPQPVLYLVGLDGDPPREIGPGMAPSWSPTGNLLAFLGPPFQGSPLIGGGPGGRATLSAPDGSAVTPVGELQGMYASWQPLLWSADGARLAAGNELIDVTSGTVVTRAPADTNTHIGTIQQLAPDGRSFTYWRNQRYSDAASAAGFNERDELLIVSDDGAARRMIQREVSACPCLPLSSPLAAFWAPSGGSMAIADSALGLRMYTAQGLPRGRLHLPAGATVAGRPYWSEDEGRLLLTLSFAGRLEAWLLSVNDDLPRRLGEGTALGWSL